MTFVKFTCMIAGINLVNDMTTKLNKIDLNLFVIFDAIYTERNLTRVAERLSITQPAVSNALTRLRKTLNDPLFVKTSTGMQPTAPQRAFRTDLSRSSPVASRIGAG